jgi:hypothetical protein
VTETTEHHYCKSPISGDQYERVYFTGESEVRFFANDNISGGGFDPSADYYKLGIPAPTSAPTVTSTGGGSTYRGYVYSFVNSYGEEGPPSPVGSDDDFNSGYVTIEGLESAPSGRAITKMYLYRTNASGTGSAEFQYVLEAAWFDPIVLYAVGDYVLYDDGGGLDLYKCTTNHSGAWDPANFTAGENVADADLLSVFPKTNYDPPPDGLTCLVSLANGAFAGFVDNILCFSEPFLPHAWPTEYQIPVDITPIGIAAQKNMIVMAGSGRPYVFFGSHPSTVSRFQGDQVLPLFDIRGIVSGKQGVFFVSKQGLIYTSGNNFENITENIIDPDTWEDLNYNDLVVHWFDKKLLAFDPVAESGFYIDFRGGTPTYISLNVYAHAGHVAEDGHFYVVADDVDLIDENNPPANMPLAVKKWEGSTINYLQYTYRSKKYYLPSPTNMAAAYVLISHSLYSAVEAQIDLEALNVSIFAGNLTGGLGIDGPLAGGHELAGDELLVLENVKISKDVTFKLYVNGVLRKSKTLSQPLNIFRLPSGYLGDRLYFELIGYMPVKKVILATSMEEL